MELPKIYFKYKRFKEIIDKSTYNNSPEAKAYKEELSKALQESMNDILFQYKVDSEMKEMVDNVDNFLRGESIT